MSPNQLQPYRPAQPTPRVTVHHVHHVEVTHHDGDDLDDLRWQLKLAIAAWLVCALVLAVAAGATIALAG